MRRLEATRALIKEWRGKAFVYGDTDCCQLVRRYVEIATGQQFGPDGYNAEEAAEILSAHGGMIPMLEHFLGAQDPADPDVVVCDVLRMRVAGVATSGHVLVPASAGELAMVSRDRIVTGWNVCPA